MAIRDPRVEEFEARLKRIFDRIDRRLEQKYKNSFPLHPARPAAGSTANPEHDGLFDVGASFSPGYGTGVGRSYVVDLNMVTLARVPDAFREGLLAEVEQALNEELKKEFPERELHVVRRGRHLFITGDLRIKE